MGPGAPIGPGEAPIGVALAGGASRRMGRDKALLEIAGRSWVELAVDRLEPICAEVLVADGGRSYLADRAREAPSVEDGPGAGPAAGILGASRARPGRALLVLACDLPHVPSALLARLAADPADWAVPCHGGRLEPLVALYRPPALAALERRVAAGLLAPHGLEEESGLRLHRLTEAELAPFGDPGHLFRNLNRPQDLG